MNRNEETAAILAFTGSSHDLRSHLANIRLALFKRAEVDKPAVKQKPARPASDAIPLTEAEQKTLAGLMPVARRVARRVAKEWEADRDELEASAISLAVDAMRRFDGRGDMKKFVGLEIRRDLLDALKFDKCRMAVRRGLAHLRSGRRRPKTCRDVVLAEAERVEGDSRYSPAEGAWIVDDPSRRMRVAEAAAAVRHNLSPRDLEILRHLNAGMKVKEIAKEMHITPGRIYQILDEARQCIERAARESGVKPAEIKDRLLTEDPAIKAKAMRLLGYEVEDFSEVSL